MPFRKPIACFSLLIAICISMAFPLGSQGADQPPDRITIASWNLEWFFDANTKDNESNLAKEQSSPSQVEWDWKRSNVASAIAQFKPTILCVQEIENRKVMLELADELKKKHNLNYRVAYIEGFDPATEQDVAILYQSGCVEFSRREQTKEQFDSKQFYNLSKHLFATFEWQIDGRTESLTLLNVHFRAKAEEAALRVRQSKLARLWLESRIQRGENVVLVGDTNIEELYSTTPATDGELSVITGALSPDPNDDLIDIHSRIPENNRRTHLILDRQFDRMFVSRSLLADDPTRKDLVLERAEVIEKVVVRGSGPDLDHWDTRFTKDFAERDLSDHFPIMATFQIR